MKKIESMNDAAKNGIGPRSVMRLGMNAVTGRVQIPLAILQQRVDEIAQKAQVSLEPASPGLRVRGSAHALGAEIIFAARVDVEGVVVEGESRLVRISISEVDLRTDADAPGPLAEAIRDGMIDTDNPATLIGNMVSLPDFVREARGSLVVLDLMRIPAIAKDDVMRTTIAAVTSYLGVKSIRVGADAIELKLGVLPGGAKEAAMSTARAALMPAIRVLWPDGRPRG